MFCSHCHFQPLSSVDVEHLPKNAPQNGCDWNSRHYWHIAWCLWTTSYIMYGLPVQANTCLFWIIWSNCCPQVSPCSAVLSWNKILTSPNTKKKEPSFSFWKDLWPRRSLHTFSHFIFTFIFLLVDPAVGPDPPTSSCPSVTSDFCTPTIPNSIISTHYLIQGCTLHARLNMLLPCSYTSVIPHFCHL